MKNRKNLILPIDNVYDKIDSLNDSDTDAEFIEFQEMKDILSSCKSTF